MTIRPAEREDVPVIVSLLAHDPLGKLRESYSDPLPQAYYDSFEKISADANQALMVMTIKEKVIGTFQLTTIHYLNYQGSSRLLVESVHIHENYRGQGLGNKAFQWIIDYARKKNVRMIQLTSDKQRPDALRFYERLGFKASHEGFKLHLS